MSVCMYVCIYVDSVAVADQLRARVKVLEESIEKQPGLSKRPGALPTLEEAWKLPIPAELNTRQGQIQRSKIQQCVEGSILNMRLPEEASVILCIFLFFVFKVKT